MGEILVSNDKRVYIDTNVFISAISRKEEQYDISKKFLDTILKDDLQAEYNFFTSGFTLLELVTNVRRKTRSKDKARSLAWQLKQSWKDKIQMLGFKTDSVPIFFDQLVETAIDLGITTGDIIHSQLMLDSKMDFLITWNKKDFLNLNKKMKKLQIMTPTEFLKILVNTKRKKQIDIDKESPEAAVKRYLSTTEPFGDLS
jgi:predicted nucleic acid-binding protein